MDDLPDWALGAVGFLITFGLVLALLILCIDIIT